MPTQYQLVFHHNNTSTEYTFDADEKFKDAKIPDETRKSAFDGILLHLFKTWWSRQLALGKFPTAKDRVAALKKLREASPAFSGYAFINAEYADALQDLIKEEKTISHDASTQVFKLMQQDGFIPNHLKEQGEMTWHNKLEIEIEKRQQRLSASQDEIKHFKSYAGSLFKTTDDVFGNYFARKLQLSDDKNNKSPEDYLTENYQQSVASEPLLHMRECEELICSLNPLTSEKIKSLREDVSKQIVTDTLDSHKDKKASIFYGGFASGSLLRDAKNVEALQQAGYDNFAFLFLDKEYENLIKAVTGDLDGFTVENEISAQFLEKTFTEFGNWVATHIKNEGKPVVIHIFSDAKEAQQYLSHEANKLTLLVGQDYFSKDGACFQTKATPDAHEDFVRMAEKGLAKTGRFYEFFKNDNVGELYMASGSVENHKEKRVTQVYNAMGNLKRTVSG